MPKANAEDIKKSFVEFVKTTPRVPEYHEAYFEHVQKLMLVGGMIKQDEAWKTSQFKDIFTNEFVHEAMKSGT